MPINKKPVKKSAKKPAPKPKQAAKRLPAQQKKLPQKQRIEQPKKQQRKRLSKDQLEAAKQLAFTLYVENGWNQKTIAEFTGISEQSVSAWKKEGNWDDQREQARLGPEHEMKRVRGMINQKLDEIQGRKPGENFPDSKEANSINMLAAAVKALQGDKLSFSHKADTGKQFITYVQNNYGQEQAKQYVSIWHEFLMATS